MMIRLYIVPGVGRNRLGRLTVRDVQAWAYKLKVICPRSRCEVDLGVRAEGLGMSAATSDGQAPQVPWQPLSARLGGAPIDQTWQEGIPPWINDPVREWLWGRLLSPRVRDRLFARFHHDRLAAPVTQSMIDGLMSGSFWIGSMVYCTLPGMSRGLIPLLMNWRPCSVRAIPYGKYLRT
jgi:hypothetical protein